MVRHTGEEVGDVIDELAARPDELFGEHAAAQHRHDDAQRHVVQHTRGHRQHSHGQPGDERHRELHQTVEARLTSEPRLSHVRTQPALRQSQACHMSEPLLITGISFNSDTDL